MANSTQMFDPMTCLAPDRGARAQIIGQVSAAATRGRSLTEIPATSGTNANKRLLSLIGSTSG